MFKEINLIVNGFGIYEMFGIFVYCYMREVERYENKYYREICLVLLGRCIINKCRFLYSERSSNSRIRFF